MNERTERANRPASTAPPAPVVLLLLLVALGGVGFSTYKGLEEAGTGQERLTRALLGVVERKDAPIDFELQDLSGATVRLSEFADKTVFLNFWATWCPPCVEEMPSLRRLHAALEKHPSFVFLAVSTDDGWDEVRGFFKREPASFPVLLDAGGEVARRWGTTKFPETYVIENGRVVGHIVGPRDWDQWFAADWLKEVLDRS